LITVGGQRLPRHAFLMAAIWLVLTAIAVPLVVWVLGPHLPPGRFTVEASDQTSANIVLTAVLVPILLLVLVFFGYSLAVFRQRGSTVEDGPPIRGHGPTQLTWVLVTAVIVTALAVWGSYTLVATARGAGGGQGPSPADVPKGHSPRLNIQVIAQQWEWTFRFPSYGGFETRQLALPVNQVVEFHVTSLDITHSFWAYRLGVKADAVPGVDNIAFTKARKTGSFTIRCAELCGLWHGHMYRTGYVMSRSDFDTWVAKQRAADSVNLKDLGPYRRTYYPEPLHRAG
jgi:cytochrome c oxidase subunit II